MNAPVTRSDPSASFWSAADEGERVAPSLLRSFAVASLIVVLGVLGAWVAVKRSGTDVHAVTADLTMDGLPTTLLESALAEGVSLTDRGDDAFAAGRVIAPRLDNALSYYRAALEQNPDDTLALAGMERVELWLDGQLDTAFAAERFDRARELADLVLELRPEDRALASRRDAIERMQALLTDGDAEFAARRYAAAARSFRELLELDAGNARAREGLRAAVAALVNAGMVAANVGDLEAARARLADARFADAYAPGIETLAERIETVGDGAVLTGSQELIARARASIDAGRLLGSDAEDAFALIETIERGWPGDPAIAGLRREAQDRLAALGSEALASSDLARMRQVYERARSLDIEGTLFGDLGDEIAWRSYMYAFERGEWRVRRVSELTPVVQQSPALPRRATRLGAGHVDVEFTIGTTGRVVDAEILESSAVAFEAPSREAIAAWRFEPVRVGGRPVPARAVMRFSFVN